MAALCHCQGCGGAHSSCGYRSVWLLFVEEYENSCAIRAHAEPSQAKPSQAKRPFGLAAVVECILTQRWQKATSATVLNVYQPCAVLEAMSCAAPHCAVEQQSLLLRNLLEQSAAHEVCLSAFRSGSFRFVSFRLVPSADASAHVPPAWSDSTLL